MAKLAKRATLDYAAFKSTLADNAPTPGLAPTVEALWYAANGFWKRARKSI